MGNKKGYMLVEFTIKVLIAILSITLLVGLLWLLYSTFTTSNEQKQAEASLDRVIEHLNAVVSSGDPIIFDINGPKNWYVTYYSAGSGSCAGKKCLCVCNDYGEANKEKCDLEGACDVIEHEVSLIDKTPQSIKIDGTINIRIVKRIGGYTMFKLLQ